MYIVISTYNDFSLLLLIQSLRNKWKKVEIYFFEDLWTLLNWDLIEEIETIYIRDPYNSNIELDKVKDLTEKILKKYPPSSHTYIDWIQSYADIAFEDKRTQYSALSSFMIDTVLWSRFDFNQKKWSYIIKLRYSSRWKWIYFNEEEIDVVDDRYIVQTKIEIEKEWRIIIVKWNVMTQWLLRNSKTEKSKVKVTWFELLNSKLLHFAETVNDKLRGMWLDFDLIWLDVVLSWDKFYLIEVNRSPQVRWNYRITGKNIFDSLY